MTGCPMAYPYACQNCSFHSLCPPSRTLEKLEELQAQLAEFKQMLAEITKAGK